jgi:hypothetical protein
MFTDPTLLDVEGVVSCLPGNEYASYFDYPITDPSKVGNLIMDFPSGVDFDEDFLAAVRSSNVSGLFKKPLEDINYYWLFSVQALCYPR